MMNGHVRDLMDQFSNPFKLKHIKSMHNNSQFELLGPCVVMASPGFMQSGVSRQLFEAWCDDARHGVVIAGYTIEGTLANDLLSAPTEIKCLDNRIKPLRCQVDHISFSAHVDYTQNKTFMKQVMPDYIILVHGEKTQMKRLKEGLESDMRKNLWPTPHKPSIAMPENGVKVKLRFRKNITAEVVGSAAVSVEESLKQRAAAGGGGGDGSGKSAAPMLPQNALLVTENFNSKLVVASELSNYTSCKFGRILEKLSVPIPAGLEVLVGKSSSVTDASSRVVDLLIAHLEEVFDNLTISSEPAPAPAPGATKGKSASVTGGSARRITVQSLVTLSIGFGAASSLAPGAGAVADLFAAASSGGGGADAVVGGGGGGVGTGRGTGGAALKPTHVLIEWAGSPVADTVADCVAGLVLQAFSAFNTLRRTLQPSSSSSSSRRDKAAERKPLGKDNIDTGGKRRKQQGEDATDAQGGGGRDEHVGQVQEEGQRAALVREMEAGEVDPSKKIPAGQYKDPKKLEALLQLLLASPLYASFFSSIQKNAEGDKLIFRGLENTTYTLEDDGATATGEGCEESGKRVVPVVSGGRKKTPASEAFVFVLFSDSRGGKTAEEAMHHAVVKCGEEGFRQAIIQTLKSIE
jgi:hypothetical protein